MDNESADDDRKAMNERSMMKW